MLGSTGEPRVLYPIYCAWCTDRKTIVGWSPVKGSDGICDYHRKQLDRSRKKDKHKVRNDGEEIR